MFSGIVEESAGIVSIEGGSSGSVVAVESKLDHSGTKVGDSICISGVCLTVVALTPRGNSTQLKFECAPETLRRTTLGSLDRGSLVNLERSLAVGSRLHGHLVTGHIDGVAVLESRKEEGNSIMLEFSFPNDLAAFIAEKGSVSIEGVSLTVGTVSKGNFKVYIIPHTAQVTTLGALKPGGRANMEVDILARYVVSALKSSLPLGDGGEQAKSNSDSNLLGLLQRHGYISSIAGDRGDNK